MARNKLYLLTFSLALLAAIMISFNYFRRERPADEEARRVRRPEKTSPPKTALSLQDQFNHVAEKSMPAVVVITARRRVAVVERPYADIYDYLYGGGQITYRDIPSGQGSGFFVSPDGYILTNFHIVRGQSSFQVVLHDGTEYPAELVGVDPPSDLALLKVNAGRKFPFLEFADISRLKIGHWAIAIGAPFSLEQTVTVGIVSHKKRGAGMNLHENFIQTDASINPGNSGGPLLDIHGKVIGVNDFILSPSGGNIGLSFAVSADFARRVCDDLIKNGKVDRPWLGIVMGTLTAEQKQSLNISRGIQVSGIYRDSPASKAGLKPGDLILDADSTAVNRPRDLRLTVLAKHPGEKIKLRILRDGIESDLEITVERPPFNLYKSMNSRGENTIPRQSCGELNNCL
ncbi:MAG: trypsin-like peptidase domain-containing protein [Victivallaceae bacterium]|nr:trypsin-like peptidase domain-containing protein [Victivallaceae bacterium]